jgi:flagellar biosynthesis/type III secretory pathway ATPase
MGAYAKGSDKELDEAILRMPRIEQYLRQAAHESVPLDRTIAMLSEAVR